MAITIQLQQVTEENDGVYTVTVNALRDNGDVLISGKTFQCRTAAELKDKIKPKFKKLIAIEQKKELIRSLAQGVIDEILNEVIQ
jgi:hypothetical protein